MSGEAMSTSLLRVPAINVAAMVFTFLVAIGLPIALLIVFRKKYKARISAFFIGCGIFVLFALVLEQILHFLVLQLLPTGPVIAGNIWLYALYGGLAAGLFEETGRLFAMKLTQKKWTGVGDALMYGAGHGGIEAILLIGIVYVNNLIYTVLVNTGILDGILSGPGGDQMLAVLEPLRSTPASQFLAAGIERILAVTLHIALSVLVWQCVRYHRKSLYFLAVALHFLVDALVVLANSYFGVWAAEAVCLVIVLATVFLTRKVYRKAAVRAQQTA